LVSGKNFTVVIDASKARDLGGNGLKGGDHTFSFTTMTPGKGGVRGKAVYPAGEPVQGAKIEVLRSGTKIGERTTDAKGAFEILDLDPGTYILRGSKDGGQQYDAEVNVSAGKIASVTIPFERAPPIAPTPDWVPWLVVGLVLAIILLVLFALMRRRKPRGEGTEEEEEERGPGEGPKERLKGVVEKEATRAVTPILKVKSETPNMATVGWESYPNDEGYIIYHSTDGRKYERIAELQKGVSSFTHKHMVPGSEHWYRMSILYSTGKESPMSKPVVCEAREDGQENEKL
jgi:hypothetical protein